MRSMHARPSRALIPALPDKNGRLQITRGAGQNRCNIMPTKQFRSVGPIILQRPTQAEIAHLRQVALVPASKIKHLQLTHHADSITIHAQAKEKLSAKAWRHQLCPRIQDVPRLRATPQRSDEQFGCRGRVQTPDTQAAPVRTSSLVLARNAFLAGLSRTFIRTPRP